MKLFVPGGVVMAALFAAAPAFSQSVSPVSPASPPPHARHRSPAASQNRSDVSAAVARAFKKLDLNRDGFVTREEIAASRAQFDERMSKSAPKRAAKMFDRLDANHDGQITEADLDADRGGSGKKPAHHRRGSALLFAEADANKDGIVTRAEFDSAAAGGKIKLRHSGMRGSALVRLFDAADAKDGRLSLEQAQQAALQHFDAVDLNHDGVLTADERRKANRAGRAERPAA